MPERPVHIAASTQAKQRMGEFQSVTIEDIRRTVEQEDIVVIGMAWNPHCKSVQTALTAAGIPYTYKPYGSYVSGWKKRLAIKLWSGWPTYPQVFVKGVLIGGNQDIRAAIADGSLVKRLGSDG